MAKRISIINFKGGVGKTTLAFHLGTGLARYHNNRVLLVDVDHQSSLSILCLGSDRWEVNADNRRAVDEVFRHFVEDKHVFPANEIIFESPMTSGDASYDGMDIVPASLELDDIEIELAATHRGNPIRSEWNKRTLLCRWIEETGVDDDYDYIVFDCPPATKIVSQNAVAASHGYVIPVVPESVMERGAPHLRDLMRTGIDARLDALSRFGESRAAYVPETQLVGLAVTQIQGARGGYTNDHSRHLLSLQELWGNALMEPYISQGTGVSAALASERPVFDYSRTQNVGGRGIDQQYASLVEEIKGRIDAL